MRHRQFWDNTLIHPLCGKLSAIRTQTFAPLALFSVSSRSCRPRFHVNKMQATKKMQRSVFKEVTFPLSHSCFFFRFSAICSLMSYFSVRKCFVASVKKNSSFLLQTFSAKVFNNHFFSKLSMKPSLKKKTQLMGMLTFCSKSKSSSEPSVNQVNVTLRNGVNTCEPSQKEDWQ